MRTEPAFDPNEVVQVPPMTRAQVGDIMRCIDGVLRGLGLDAPETCFALATLLTQAVPVAKPEATAATGE